MQRIDAHQHFWKFDPVRDNWINSDMAIIARDFLPNDLLPLLQRNNIDGTVLVQTCHMDEDNRFMLELADQHSFIKGVVGWVNLQSIKVEDKLKYYHERYPKMKGFRHVLQSDPDDQLMLRDSFKNGISLLNKYNFTYDILIYPKHLKYAAQLAAEFPDQKFVVDHLAKPHIKTKEIIAWKRDIEALSKHLNVYCKVSGMLTEADWYSWKTDDFMPYLDTVFNAFSINRVIYGSDWPVCKLAGGYNRALEILQIYTSRFSENEQAQFYGGNAIEFYNLTD
jgi:L-fuconolactonase